MSRPAQILEVDGERKTFAEWSAWAKATLGIELPAAVIRKRLRDGDSYWTPKLAVSKPVDRARSVLSRLGKEVARENRGQSRIVSRRGPAGLAPFLRDGKAGQKAREALPKSPPRRK